MIVVYRLAVVLLLGALLASWSPAARAERTFLNLLPFKKIEADPHKEYSLVDDYLERRAALREEHLGLAQAAHDRGELLLAGVLPDPYDRALLVWTAPREVVEEFVARDPYVVHGLVSSWTIRPWNVVVG